MAHNHANTPIDLGALESALEAATPLPWAYDSGATSGAMGIWHMGSGGSIFDVSDEYPRGDNAPQENCELVVLAINALPTLIARVRAAEELNAKLFENLHGEQAESRRRIAELEADLKLERIEADNWRHAAQHPEIYTLGGQGSKP